MGSKQPTWCFHATTQPTIHSKTI